MVYEYTPDNAWKGVAANIEVWPCSLTDPDGHHVSSLYVRRGQLSNIHIETGITKWYGWTGSRGFWQYCDSEDTDNIHFDFGATLAANSTPYFEANNFTMHNSSYSWDEWRMAWDGQVIRSQVMFNLRSGTVEASNERLHVTPTGTDESPASCVNVKKKNNSASWSLWVARCVKKDEDPYYNWHLSADYPNSSFWESRP